MSLSSILLMGLAFVLAYANGSNDVSKGIATLVGSGVSNFKTAVVWGAAWTAAGGLLATLAGRRLAATFSGQGFLESPIAGSTFLGSVAIGAIVWVLFASRTGLPVSTTHAIAGALAGAAITAQGAGLLHWSHFAKKVAFPLALSPLVALGLISAVFPLLRRAIARAEGYCVCIERRALVAAPGALSVQVGAATIVSRQTECASSPAVAARVSAVDALHWLSSALTSLARAVNDTPKVAALGIASAAMFGTSGFPLYAAVTAGMAAGSLLAGFRVTETLARKVTPMTHGEGFAANLVTSVLVGLASFAALPVSTTHVSSGAIIGIGLHRGDGAIHWTTVREMLLAWLVTLPASAAVGAGAFALLRAIA